MPDVIPFSEISVRQKRTSSKTANRHPSEVKANLVSLAESLTVYQQDEAINLWRRGVSIRYIASMMGNGRDVIEALIWCYTQRQEPRCGDARSAQIALQIMSAVYGERRVA